MTNVVTFPQKQRAAQIEVLADRLLNDALAGANGDADLAACAAERAMNALLNMLPRNG